MRSLILVLVILRLGISLDPFMSLSSLVMRDVNRYIMLVNQNCSCDCFPIYSLILSINHSQILLFLFLIFWLSISSSHFQRIKLIKVSFTKYKSKLIRITIVTIHIQLTVSIVVWIIITVTPRRVLFKMSCVISIVIIN